MKKYDIINRILQAVYYVCTIYGKFRLRKHLHLFRTRPAEAIPPEYTDLWFLYRIARKRRPGIILEFGSGCSTLILAQALKENGSGFLYSLDSSPYWTEINNGCIPPILKQFCEIRYSPVIEESYNGTPVFKYADVPDVIPNFVYLDGPPLTERIQVAADLLDIEECFPRDFCMVIDGRIKNAYFLKQNFKRDYVFKRRDLFKNFIFEVIG